jgi:hypothetical protein
MDELRFKRCKALKELLSSPLMSEAMANCHLDIINALLMTDPKDSADREALYNESKAFTRLTGRLQSLANEAIVEESKVQKAKGLVPMSGFGGAN